MTDEVLSAAAMAVYERLITAAAIPIGPDDVSLDDPVVCELLEAGFAEVSPDEPPQLLPVAPVAAFERVLTGLQEEFLDQQRQLLEAYNYLDGLQQRFLETQPASDADALADIRPTEGAFGEAIEELVASADKEILCWNITLQPPVEDSGAVGGHARIRTVYDTTFLHDQGGALVLRRARAAGEDLRIADELASSMLIVDETAVALPLTAVSAGALVIRSPLVINAMREFFEMIWHRSVPWIDRDSPDEVLSPVQRQVVALMAIGHSDEEVARHLGLSLRTVRRHVAEVMERLQAGTRFAAGIAAARAGLLDDAELPPSEA